MACHNITNNTCKYKLGNIAIVTGATKGLGLECVKYLLDNNVKNIMMSARSSYDQIEKDIQDLQNKYPNSKICYSKCDVKNFGELKNLFEKTKTLFGDINIVVNNAGIYDEKDWNKCIDVNLNGVIMGTKLGFHYMGKDQGGHGGTIINMASILGIMPASCAPVYSATKHAIIGYTRSMGQSYYFDKSQIRVMAMMPGVTETPLISQARQNVDDDPLLMLWKKEIGMLPSQETHHVGKCLIEMLREGRNGSLWVTEDKKIYEISIPDLQYLKN